MALNAIVLPFSFGNGGKVENTTDPKTIWKQRVLSVLLTKFGERLVRPDFGSSLPNSLFENSAVAIDMATRSVNIAFNTWLSTLKLLGTDIKYDETTGHLDIAIVYQLPSGEQDSLAINSAIFNRSGDLIQEITNG